MTVKVRAIPVGFDNVYLVQDAGAILVDGGEPGKFEHLKVGLSKAGVSPKDIRLIVVTHGHWDHIGCLAQIKALTGAPIAMHQSERERIERPMIVMPPGVTRWGKLLDAVIKATVVPSLKIPPAKVDIGVSDDGMSLEPFGISGQVLHTPGHSPGSMCVVLASGDALVGDLAMNRFPVRFGPGLPIFAEDPSRLKSSIEKLLAAGAKTIHPAHGGPFPARVLERALESM